MPLVTVEIPPNHDHLHHHLSVTCDSPHYIGLHMSIAKSPCDPKPRACITRNAAALANRQYWLHILYSSANRTIIGLNRVCALWCIVESSNVSKLRTY